MRNFSKEETIEFYKYSELLRFQSMQQLQNFQGNEYYLPSEMIFQQQVMKDKLFLRYGIEEDDFNRAILEHQVHQEPEVQQFIQDQMKDLPPEMMQNIMLQMMGNRGDFQDLAQNE